MKRTSWLVAMLISMNATAAHRVLNHSSNEKSSKATLSLNQTAVLRSSQNSRCQNANLTKDTNESMSSARDSDGCKCYCGGQSWSPGSTACLGGWKYVCVDRSGDGKDCGWDPKKLGSDQLHCDGGENCNTDSQ